MDVIKKKEKKQKLNIFLYNDYRLFLRDYYLLQKSQTDFFSYRYFSLKAGFSSHNVLKKVINGERNIAPRSIKKFCKALNLDENEASYFQLLVLYNQSNNENEKELLFNEMNRFYKKMGIKYLSDKETLALNEYYIPIIREIVTLRDFKEDYFMIAEKVIPPITPEQARNAFRLLEATDLLRRDAEGNLYQTETLVRVHEGKLESAQIRKIRVDAIHVEEYALDHIDPKDRFSTFNVISLTMDQYNKIRLLLQKIEDELITMGQEETSQKKTDVVYQLNMHFFPVYKVEPANDGDKM